MHAGSTWRRISAPGGDGGIGNDLRNGTSGGEGVGVEFSWATGTSVLFAGGGGGGGGGGFQPDEPNGYLGNGGGDAVTPLTFGVEAPGGAGVTGITPGIYPGEGGNVAGQGIGGQPTAGAWDEGSPGTDAAGRGGGDGGESATYDNEGMVWRGGGGGGGGGGFTGGGGGAGGGTGSGGSNESAGGGGGAGSSFVSDTFSPTASDPRDEFSLGNIAPDIGDAAARFVPCRYDLGITKTPVAPLPNAGDSAEFDITVTNFGPDPMAMSGDTVVIDDSKVPSPYGPLVTDFLPVDPATDITFDSAGAEVYGADFGMADDGTRCTGTDIMAGVECDPLGVGDSYTVRVRQVVGNSSPGNVGICNTASHDGDRPGGPDGPDEVTACSGLNGYNLAVTETAPTDAFAGDNITWTITVTNDGPADMEGPYDSDDLAIPGLYSLVITDDRLMEAISTMLPPECVNNGNGTLTCDPLDSGDSYTFQLTTATDPDVLGTVIWDEACATSTFLWDTAQIGDTSPEWSDNCATAGTAISRFPAPTTTTTTTTTSTTAPVTTTSTTVLATTTTTTTSTTAADPTSTTAAATTTTTARPGTTTTTTARALVVATSTTSTATPAVVLGATQSAPVAVTGSGFVAWLAVSGSLLCGGGLAIYCLRRRSSTIR